MCSRYALRWPCGFESQYLSMKGNESMFTKHELKQMLDDSGVSYDFDIKTPGIQYANGAFQTYQEV